MLSITELTAQALTACLLTGFCSFLKQSLLNFRKKEKLHECWDPALPVYSHVAFIVFFFFLSFSRRFYPKRLTNDIYLYIFYLFKQSGITILMKCGFSTM